MQWGVTIGSIYFNAIDIIVFSLAIIAGIVGTLGGFAKAFAHRSGYIVGFFAGLMFTKIVAELLAQSFYLGPLLSSLVAWVVLFLVGYALMRIVGGLLETALTATGLRQVNALLGFLWGVLELAIACALILYVLELQRVFDLSSVMDKSQFVTNVVRPLVPESFAWIGASTGLGNV
jgi:membrane protein required for colicin V production